MIQRFYKTSDQAVLAALQTHYKEADALIDRAREFAAALGGKPVYSNGTDGIRILGVCFDPPKSCKFWTQPDAKQNNIQRPRQTLQGATKEEKQAHAQLRGEWALGFPIEKASYEDVLRAMGTHWGDTFFAGFAQFEHEDVVYVATGVQLAPCMEEILGSEYQAAHAAFKSAKAEGAANE